MNYCGPRGIPLDTFLSWPESSQEAALLWAAQEARRHPECGTLPEDWPSTPDPDAEPQHWHPQVCPGCRVRDLAAAELENDSDKDAPGLRLVPIPGPQGQCAVCQVNT